MANTDYKPIQEIVNDVWDQSEGKLKTTATISGDVNVDSNSVDTSGYVGKAGGTNGDFTVAYTSATTITLSSLPSDVSAFTADDIVTVMQIASTGAVTNTYTRDDATMTMSGNVLTVTGATFASGDTFVVYTNVKGVIKTIGDDSSTQAIRTSEINPVWMQYQGSTILDLTNITAGTDASVYSDVKSKRFGTWQLETSGTTPTDVLTVTMLASAQDDGTAIASLDYQDVTNSWFGVASIVDSDELLERDTPMSVAATELNYTTSATGGNDADLTVYEFLKY